MKDYVAENDRILEEWRKTYIQVNQSKYPDCTNLHEYFTPDGIMYKGEFKEEWRSYEDGKTLFRWRREASGMENILWTDAPLRILYLTKDQNTCGDVAWDVRSESFRYRDIHYKPEDMQLDTNTVFFRNLVYSLYGIMNTTVDNPLKFDFSNEDALAFVDKQIFARINCKKEVGESRCSNNKLLEAINDKNAYNYLKDQILNLDADIFVCCGYSKMIEDSGNIMLNFLNQIGYSFKQDDKDNWIYYDSEKKKIAINSYHLSYLQFDCYGLLLAYSKFIREHPNFLNSHRNNLK